MRKAEIGSISLILCLPVRQMSENPYESPDDGVQVGRRGMGRFLKTVLSSAASGVVIGLVFMVPSIAGSDFEPIVTVNGKQQSPWYIVPFLGLVFLVMGILFAATRSIIEFLGWVKPRE